MLIIYFYYDGVISEIEKELISDIEAEVVADLPEAYTINAEVFEVKYSQKIFSKDRIVYSRYE